MLKLAFAALAYVFALSAFPAQAQSFKPSSGDEVEQMSQYIRDLTQMIEKEADTAKIARPNIYARADYPVLLIADVDPNASEDTSDWAIWINPLDLMPRDIRQVQFMVRVGVCMKQMGYLVPDNPAAQRQPPHDVKPVFRCVMEKYRSDEMIFTVLFRGLFPRQLAAAGLAKLSDSELLSALRHEFTPLQRAADCV